MSIARIHGAGELLASVETLLGFAPKDSVLVIGVDKRGRLGILMRVDRSDCLIPQVARELGRSMALQLRRGGLSEAVLISFTDKPLASPCEALDSLVPHLRETINVRDAWKVSDGRYRSQWCLDARCCPREGTALPAVPIAVGTLPRGDSGTSAPSSGPAAVPHAQRRRVVRARDRALARRDQDRQAWCALRFSEWRAAVTEALDGRLPRDAMCGRLLAGLDDVRVRDAAIVDLNAEFSAAADAVLRGESDARVASALNGLLGKGAAPDPARVEAAVDLAMHLGRMLAGRRRDTFAAAPYCIAAIGLWWLDDACGARHCVDAALDFDPTYHLAQLIGASLAAGLGPEDEPVY